MNHQLRYRLAAVASTVALLTAVPAAAQADPKGDTFDIQCSNGETYTITTPPADADWTPGFFSDSQTVIIPTTFEFSFTATDPEGNVVFSDTGTDAKGGGNVTVKRNPVTCTFGETVVLTETDPESGLPAGSTFSFEGTVTGFLTGRPS